MRRRDPNIRAVFDSDEGKIEASPKSKSVDRSSVAKLRLETASRRGKAVSVVYELPLDSSEIKELAKELKKACSSGGSVKDERIEIQGDHRDAIGKVLDRRGIVYKRSGG
jgi:translation initiation factor 1